MREIRTSGSEGGGVISSPYPYQIISRLRRGATIWSAATCRRFVLHPGNRHSMRYLAK